VSVGVRVSVGVGVRVRVGVGVRVRVGVGVRVGVPSSCACPGCARLPRLITKMLDRKVTRKRIVDFFIIHL
jgi:hypothetical protein